MNLLAEQGACQCKANLPAAACWGFAGRSISSEGEVVYSWNSLKAHQDGKDTAVALSPLPASDGNLTTHCIHSQGNTQKQ